MHNLLTIAPQALSFLCLLALSHAALAQSAPHAAGAAPAQLSGVIRIWGSPQMGDLLKRYEERFHKLQPSVQFEDNLKSTITAAAGVYTGRADIGLLGREIWPTEVQAFASIAGHPPTVVDVATGSFDVPKATFALMVFVPRGNPLASLSTGQLERAFGNTTRAPVRTWGDLGLKGPWAARPVHLYGFTVDNDKSQIFAQLLFHPGERWNPHLHEFANSPGLNGADAGELIVRAVAADPNGIGISNLHYATPAVKALPLTPGSSPRPIEPAKENIASRLYPLTRAVYMVVDLKPEDPAAPLVLEFLKFVLGSQGRDAVLEEGNYLPLPPDIAARQLRGLPASLSAPRK